MNKSEYIVSRAYQFCWQYGIILVRKTWSSANEIIEAVEHVQSWECWWFLLIFFVYSNDWFKFICNWFFATQSELSINMNSPIRKLLISIDQLYSIQSRFSAYCLISASENYSQNVCVSTLVPWLSYIFRYGFKKSLGTKNVICSFKSIKYVFFKQERFFN